jgi:hypothetical protein
MEKSRIVYFFRKQDEDTKQYFFNNAVQHYTGSKYIHCELYFVERDRTVSINSNTSVLIRRGSDKKYSDRKKWTGYIVYLSHEKEEKMWKSCKKDKGKGFDYFAIYCFCMLPCRSRIDKYERMVCSKQVAKSSIEAGIFDNSLDPESYTPSLIHKKLMNLKKSKDVEVIHITNWPMLPSAKKLVVN